MKPTRRSMIQISAAGALAAAQARANQGATSGKRRVLAILGDAYHAPAYLDAALVGRLRKAGWQAETVIDYDVPWNEFGGYDLIILSREGREYVRYYRERDADPPNRGEARWLTPAQEDRFEEYVQAGGRLFLYHDGFGAYPKGNGVSRVARAYFIRHPPIVPIQVKLTGKMPELTQGVTPFEVADEEYEVEMDENQTSVFLESTSPEHGRHAQGWAHSYSKGKVAVLIPGHSVATINHPMIQRCIQNCLDWLTR
ncbi:MAG: ThuA domain-containing protein [Bryobacteraceae bacterium]|nr:ThuA domain-containing protein [Bryobacteraceae bacterium]